MQPRFRRTVRRIPIPVELDIPPNREQWMAFGACVDLNPQYEIFFPDNPDSRKNHQQELAAKSICASCPVAWECFDFSVRNHEYLGVWGGMNRDERCDLTQKYQGHTSPVARAAHRRHITELNCRKQALDADRSRRLRAVG